MNTTNISAANTYMDFSLLSDCARHLASGLGLEIVAFREGFGAVKDGDVISGEYTSDELEAWFNGYESGKDDIEIVDQLDRARLLRAELVKAEQIIQSMMAAMTDAQKLAASSALTAIGLRGAKSPCRSAERQALILASPVANGNAS